MSAGGLGRTYSDGEIVVRQGESGDCMFAVQEGRLAVLKDANGAEVRIAVLEPGDIFGEMAIFEREVRSATIRALGDARVLTVDKKTFLRRVQEDPSIAFNLVRMMSRRIRKLSAEVAAFGKAEPAGARPQAAWPAADRRRGVDRRSGVDRRKGDRRAASDGRGAH